MPQSHTFFQFFHFLSFDPPKKWKKSWSHTENFLASNNFSLFYSNPQSALFTFFFTLGENGGWSQEAPSEGPNRARPLLGVSSRNPLFGVSYVGKNMYLGRISEETRLPYMDMVYTWFTHVINACSTSW